ncbi:Rne/Rng family ribonuclease [Kamptonema formosum]|uniref:Rne/Rng family ribonuclease n=1 Tax=Kamptonema formosum TaxID=331992 RepID=UPI000346A390|nr:Rne/Rng family ribonuclease [Oscillatoria sp. PCC 10802]
MPKQIIIAEQHRIAAVFSEDQIQELVVATGQHQVGDIYLGIVENVLPGIDAAFVNIGDSERNGFIHVTDLGPLRLKRSAGSITELLVPQQKVLVQVMKEPTGSKGPRLTGNITLPGRYLVLMPFGRGVNLSRRIRSESERNRLRALAILIKPAGMGLLVRTEAEGMAEEAILEDLEFLQRQWESIQQEGNSTRPPALLNRDDDFIQRVLRDMYSTDVNRIVVDSPTGIKRVKQHLLSWSGGKAPQGVLIDHHRERTSILEYFRVNAAIREALKPRVDLPSGGYIIIEPTEALTVIDVNSGSFTRSSTARETVLWTNCEAATEIARQLRLRNIAGVIIVDFIDMDSRRDQLQVLEHFNKALKSDKARPQIAQLSELGLVELTRKRQGQNIYELFGRGCPTCGGLGHLVHLPGEADTQPGEPVERLVPVALREPRMPELAEVVSDGLDMDESSPLTQLDLLNHPSYQERGGADSRRRRRRRIDLTETPAAAEEEGAGVSPLPAARITPAAPVKTPKPEAIPETEPAVPDAMPAPLRAERVERTRAFTRETALAAPEPPEVVTVEMTPEEQEVYALMGISPLVLVNREVKNPKSAVISVVTPGQSPNPDVGIEPLAVEPAQERRTAAGSRSASLSSRYEQPEIDRSERALLELPEPEPAEPAAADESPSPATAAEPASELSDSESSAGVTRRRRRRSSAADS